VLTYKVSHIVRDYRDYRDYSKRFKVDYLCTLDDLGKIGVLSPGKLEIMKQAELQRREKKVAGAGKEMPLGILRQLSSIGEPILLYCGLYPGAHLMA